MPWMEKPRRAFLHARGYYVAKHLNLNSMSKYLDPFAGFPVGRMGRPMTWYAYLAVNQTYYRRELLSTSAPTASILMYVICTGEPVLWSVTHTVYSSYSSVVSHIHRRGR